MKMNGKLFLEGMVIVAIIALLTAIALPFRRSINVIPTISITNRVIDVNNIIWQEKQIGDNLIFIYAIKDNKPAYFVNSTTIMFYLQHANSYCSSNHIVIESTTPVIVPYSDDFGNDHGVFDGMVVTTK